MMLQRRLILCDDDVLFVVESCPMKDSPSATAGKIGYGRDHG
jgi:hypothetical protein